MTEVIDTNTIEKRNGSTKAQGTYSIIREDDGDVLIKADFWVKKTGVAGTGHGVMAFALLNAEGERIFKIDKGFTVGADAWDGVNKKSHSESTSLFGNFFDTNVVGVAFNVQADRDSIGLPQSPDEWLDVLGTAVPVIIGGLGAGGEQAIAGWIIRKLR